MRICLLFLGCFLFSIASAQNERGIARKANKYYLDSLFLDSEVLYRKSLSKNNEFSEAKFNLADALFKQDRYDESISLLKDVVNTTHDSLLKAESYYNMGNNFLKQQKIEEAIDSYKNSLLINPDDEEARYNLSKSMSLLNQENKNNEDENQKDEDEKESQESGQTDGEEQDEKDQSQQEKENNESSAGNNSNESSQDNQQEDALDGQGEKDELSKEDMKRILEALDREEKKVQEKMKKVNLSNKKQNSEKDW